MTNYKDLDKSFEILDLDKNANYEDIKKAYHRLAKIYHPDKISDDKKKAEAEKEFKDIKKAYDNLMQFYKDVNENKDILDNDYIYTNNNFSDFFTKKVEDDFNYVNLNDTQNKKDKMINDFVKYIKNNKISTYDVYMATIKNQPIYKAKVGYNSSQMMEKDQLYRSYLKTTPDFIKFEMNYKLMKNLDIRLKVYYNQKKYQNKPLNFDFIYKYKSICSHCEGWGCNKCNKGIVLKNKKLNIKIPKCENNKVLILNNQGHFSPWKKGNIIIEMVEKENYLSAHKTDFSYKLVNNYIDKIPLLKTINSYCQEAVKKIVALYTFLCKHQIHTFYISVIVILLIIIIVLATVL